MKNVLMLMILMLAGCTKDSNQRQNFQSNGGVASGYTQYVPFMHWISLRNMQFDTYRNITAISQLDADTPTLNFPPFIDSDLYYFTVNPATNLPAGYTSVTKKTYYTQPQIMTFRLYFNIRSQLVIDSAISIAAGDPFLLYSTYYQYTANSIIATSILSRDTIILSNGNVAYHSAFISAPYVGYSSFSRQNFQYSNKANPFYDNSLSNNMGPFLMVHGIIDAISKNLPDEGYTWHTNSEGFVDSGYDDNGRFIHFTYP